MNLYGTHLAAMVNETREIAFASGVNDRVFVDTEQIAAANAQLLVSLLSHVGHLVPNYFADISTPTESGS